MYFSVNGIIGLSLGFEYQDDGDFDYLVIDIFFIRFVVAKEKNETN